MYILYVYMQWRSRKKQRLGLSHVYIRVCIAVISHGFASHMEYKPPALVLERAKTFDTYSICVCCAFHGTT